MKFIASKEKLLKLASTSEILVSSKLGFSAAANMLLKAEAGKCTVKSTNLEVSFEASFEVKVEKEGAICLPQQQVVSTLRELPPGDLEVELLEENMLRLKPVSSTRRVLLRILGIPAEEFPDIAAVNERKECLSIEKTVFRKIIQKTAFAAATHSTKYALNGIFLGYEKEKLSVVATDGRRMAVYETKIADTTAEDFKVILPAIFLQNLQRAIFDEGPLKFWFDDKSAFFLFDGFTISSRLVDGDFPDYKSFLPRSHSRHVNMERPSFNQSIQTAQAIYPSTELSLKKITLDIQSSEVQVKSYGDKKSASEEAVNAKLVEGEPLKVAFNLKMLSEVIKNVESETLDLYLENDISPVIIREGSGGEYFYVLMPVRLSDFS